MTQLLFTAFSNRPDALDLAREAAERLQGSGITSSVHILDSEELPVVTDKTLVVSLGGDGTFLRSARIAHQHNARLVGVNLGRLGFLLNVQPSELVTVINEALVSSEVDHRIALEISYSGNKSEFAMNEVVIERAESGHMVRVKTFVDNEEFLSYSADGVMVSTPTGSTGYNFSAGGPVVDATLPLMILTPIAPHFTIGNSIVVGAEKKFRFVIESNRALVVADGHTVTALNTGDSVEVSVSQTPVRVVATRSFDLGVRLRQGLREGHA